MRPLLASLLICCAALSCSKDDSPVVAIPAGGTWTLSGVSAKAAYSEIDARSGYQLRFSDSLGSSSISFLFRSRPATDATLSPAADTSANDRVVIRIVRDGLGYHSEPKANTGVTVSLPANKLHIQAAGIRMLPDTAGPAELNASFSLREF